MSRTADLARLFAAVAHGDLHRARALATDIAEAEDRAGKPGAALSLRKALTTRNGARDADAPLASAAAVMPDLLTPLPPAAMADVRLTAPRRRLLAEVVNEHRHRGALQANGLEPRSKLFFHGPPGCGKTLAARALATELGLPAFVVRFDTLLGAYLGQTSLRLRETFQFAASQQCVLLLDEIDAVGRTRGKATDIGELDRVVISLMQQLDLVHPAGIVIAASNVPDELDPALRRRFDLALEFPVPSASALTEYTRKAARARGIPIVNGISHKLASAKTFAEAEQILVDEHRRLVLRGV